MGTVTTEYAINLRYMMQSQSVVTGAQKMTRELQQAERASAGLGMSFGKLAALAGGAVSFYQAKKSLIDFNSGMEQAKITMAGLMEQAGRGEFTQNLGAAGELVKQMQLDARASIGTTEDFVQMASMLVQPLTMAGGSMQNLRDMTRQTVVAAKSMGIEAGVASRDIDQAIRGQYRSVDPFSGKILTPLGYGGEEGRKKFNALSMQQRMAEVERALAAPAIAKMAKAQETSFEGVASTLKDNLQMSLGKVGIPLFKGVTAELKQWNEWLDKNQSKVEEFARDFGHDLLTTAKAFTESAKWAAEHWKQLLGAAVALKATGVLASMSAGAGAAGAAGVAGAAGAAGVPFAGKMAAITLVASAVYMGGTYLADLMDKWQSESMRKSAVSGEGTIGGAIAALNAYGSTSSSAEKDRQARIFGQLMQSGGIKDVSAFKDAISNMGGDERMRLARSLGMNTRGSESDYIRGTFGPQMFADAIALKMGEMFDRKGLTDAFTAMHDAMTSGSGMDYPSLPFQNQLNIPKPEKPKINVTIHRIEVASDDGDRWAMGFTDWVANVARNPANAMHAIREAG